MARLLAYDASLIRPTTETRTRLSEGEALSFIRRTVILNADEAKRDGITEGTAEFVVPNQVTPQDIRLTADTSPMPITRRPVG